MCPERLNEKIESSYDYRILHLNLRDSCRSEYIAGAESTKKKYSKYSKYVWKKEKAGIFPGKSFDQRLNLSKPGCSDWKSPGAIPSK
jgi:hypothetical protein